ncbi:MAG TPA: alpha/beta hydrolase [Candidatus Limnocylindrales bacterium]|nr:alpha/beta hydrolase [Candidatus Limnocylindrales bacterium]
MTGTALPDAVASALIDPSEGERISVEASGIPWSALCWGDPGDRPLLLIHGVTSSAEVWWRVGPALAATGRRVIAVDQAGHGQTGHWRGHYRFRDNAADIAGFIGSAGLDRPDLQVIGHSWGAATAAALPAAGIRPATMILLDPPVLPLERIALEASDPSQQPVHSIEDAIAAVRIAQPDWIEGDVMAKAKATMQLDVDAARSVLLDNGDWDGGLGDLLDPAAQGIDVWLVRGEPATGGYVDDAAARGFGEVIGDDHVVTIAGGPHSPQRTHPVETVAAFLRALGPAG